MEARRDGSNVKKTKKSLARREGRMAVSDRA
jgi:hypothetical protein